MSAKKNKMDNQKNLFEKCEACNIVLLSKDLKRHMESFHGKSKSQYPQEPYGFIKGKIIHGPAKVISKNDEKFKHLPQFLIDEIAVISSDAMDYCQIGGLVVVSKDEQTFVTLKTHRARGSCGVDIGLSSSTLELLGCRSGSTLHVVKRVPDHQRPAKVLKLEVLNPGDRKLEDCAKFQSFFNHEFEQKLIVPGNLLTINYYGKVYKFGVPEIDGDVFVAGGPSSTDNSYLSTSLQQSDLCSDISHIDLNAEGSFLGDVPLPAASSFSSTPKRKKSRGICCCERTLPTIGNITYFVNLETIIDFGLEIDAESKKKNTLGATFADMGGLSKQIEKIRQIIFMPLDVARCMESWGAQQHRGIVLYGPMGCGKTFLGKAIAHEMKGKFIVINGGELFTKYHGEAEANLRNIFQEAKQKAPCVIFIDNIDDLCPKPEESNSQAQRVVKTLQTLMDELPTEPSRRVIVVAATRNLDCVDAGLRGPGRLTCKIEIGVPTASEREEILRCHFNRLPHNLSDSQIHSVASDAHGYVGADLALLCFEGGQEALKRLSIKGLSIEHLVVEYEDMVNAMKEIKPCVLKDNLIEIPNVRWEDIGGQEELKLKLRQAIEWPITHPEVLQRLGITPAKGILMHGPPGCSKTLIAKALATESKLNFIAIQGPELFNKYVGQSERSVREVFRKARAAAPCILYFDEFDSLTPERGSSTSSNQVENRVVAQILCEMDGSVPLRGVTVVAATNRLDRIDKALLRPGRFDCIVEVPLPSPSTREEILGIKLRRVTTGADVCVADLVSRTDGYSGAEVVDLWQRACSKAFIEEGESEVTMKYFEHALKTKVYRRAEPDESVKPIWLKDIERRFDALEQITDGIERRFDALEHTTRNSSQLLLRVTQLLESLDLQRSQQHN